MAIYKKLHRFILQPWAIHHFNCGITFVAFNCVQWKLNIVSYCRIGNTRVGRPRSPDRGSRRPIYETIPLFESLKGRSLISSLCKIGIRDPQVSKRRAVARIRTRCSRVQKKCEHNSALTRLRAFSWHCYIRYTFTLIRACVWTLCITCIHVLHAVWWHTRNVYVFFVGLENGMWNWI